MYTNTESNYIKHKTKNPTIYLKEKFYKIIHSCNKIYINKIFDHLKRDKLRQ